MAESAVMTVLGSVGNLAVQETKFLCVVTTEVTFLKQEVMRLNGYLKDAESKRRSGNAAAATLLSQIRDAAYDAENVIEVADYMEKRNRLKKGFMGAISRYARLPSDLISLHKVGVEIQRVRRKLSEIFQSAAQIVNVIDLDSHVVDEFPQDYGLMQQHLKDDFVMVGFEDEYKEIVNKLVQGENILSAVSIVAMGGAGKTTLATKVHTSPEVKQHFEAVAMVTVSQNFKVIDLLKKIVKQISSGGDESSEMNEYEVGKKIHDILLQKRYLLVLDDVWEADTWKQINATVKAFPDATNGSRVLLTTRKEDVANHVEMPTYVHPLKFLDEEKSWELFSSKALPPYRISAGIRDLDKFEELGRNIARKCDGLPLALAVLGGYLSKNLTIQEWSDVLLSWPSTKDTRMMRDIIARSYKDLSNHYLRSCLLYLAVFPEDYIISVPDLIELWIGESFIPRTAKHTLEETARKYVSELAQRCLVQVVELETSSMHGWIKTIRIHDMLRDWCIEEARQDGFLDVIEGTTDNAGQVGALSSGTLMSYRSSFQNSSDQILQATSNLRTLHGFGLPSVIFPEVRFLRVLRVEHSSLPSFSRVIGGCIHLRYLGLIRCEDVMLPSSIGKLLYLQTVDLRGTTLESREVSSSLWDIPALRHVYTGANPLPRSVQHIELQTLGVIFRRFVELPRSHQFPQTLRKLYVDVYGNEQDPMPILEKLPCLVVLRLERYRGSATSFCAQGFPRLQELELTHCVVTGWRMEVGTMPKLSHLTFTWCRQMTELPEGLLHLPSLRFVLLDGPYICDNNTLNGLRQKGCEVDARSVRTGFTTTTEDSIKDSLSDDLPEDLSEE